jgi:hypothetical protein
MKARILLLVAFFILPNFLLAQNLSAQQFPSFSLHQKKIKSFFDNNSDLNLIESVNSFKLQSDSLPSSCDSATKSLYAIRFAGNDSVDCINFYGISFGGGHHNKVATFSGLAFNGVVGDFREALEENNNDNISINGINISLIYIATAGAINGISCGGVLGSYSTENNGIALGLLGAGAVFLNGLAIGGIGCVSENVNGILIGGIFSFSKNANAFQISGIINGYCNFNGIGIAAYNSREGFDSSQVTNINGLILGIYNDVSVRGLSIGIVNNGNSWLQIGLLNMGDSSVQIGLVNLDGNNRMGIPIINVNY